MLSSVFGSKQGQAPAAQNQRNAVGAAANGGDAVEPKQRHGSTRQDHQLISSKKVAHGQQQPLQHNGGRHKRSLANGASRNALTLDLGADDASSPHKDDFTSQWKQYK